MKKFGKFHLLERIGEGGMAEVFLARPSDVALSKLIALKRVLPSLSNEKQFREMFRYEGEIALRFRHPAIATVHEFGEVNDNYYMAMEFFPGKTVAEILNLLRDGRIHLEVAEKVFIIKTIADALQYIHDFRDHGDRTEIIHRDISPQNIIVGFDGEVKLIDFGVAKINSLRGDTESKTIKGKVAYMSPEQNRGEKLNNQTDVFSLGIVMWELLFCRKLFTGKTLDEVSQKIESCDIPLDVELASSVSFELSQICHRALAKNLSERYRSARELSAELDGYLRRYGRGDHQNRIAKVMSLSFPADIRRLRAKLRKYEVARVNPLANFLAGSRPARVPKQEKHPDVLGKVLPRFLVFVIVACSLGLITTLHGGSRKYSQIKKLASETIEASRESLQLLSEPDRSASGSREVAKAALPLPLPSEPVLAKKPLEKSKVAVLKKPFRKPIRRNHIEAALPRQSATEGGEKLAQLTVFAEPNSQIFINERLEGTEMVVGLSVPAEELVVIRVKPESGNRVISRVTALKALSNNIIDLTDHAERTAARK